MRPGSTGTLSKLSNALHRKSKSPPRPKKLDRADQKNMRNVFFDCEVLVCYDFIAICQTELGYIKFLKRRSVTQGNKNESTVTIIVYWNPSTVTKFT